MIRRVGFKTLRTDEVIIYGNSVLYTMTRNTFSVLRNVTRNDELILRLEERVMSQLEAREVCRINLFDCNFLLSPLFRRDAIFSLRIDRPGESFDEIDSGRRRVGNR